MSFTNYLVLQINHFVQYAHPNDTYEVLSANRAIPEKYWFGGFTGSIDVCTYTIKTTNTYSVPVFESCVRANPNNSYHRKIMKEKGLWK